jgi:hypothetical protein
VNPILAIFLTVLLGSSMYAAGRLHARVGYRFGYRFGYRQGYFDGDRACWNRLRREAQGAIGREPEGADPAGEMDEVVEPSVVADPHPVPAAPASHPGRTNGVYSGRPTQRRPPAIAARGEGFAILREDAFVAPGTTYASNAAQGRHSSPS